MKLIRLKIPPPLFVIILLSSINIHAAEHTAEHLTAQVESFEEPSVLTFRASAELDYTVADKKASALLYELEPGIFLQPQLLLSFLVPAHHNLISDPENPSEFKFENPTLRLLVTAVEVAPNLLWEPGITTVLPMITPQGGPGVESTLDFTFKLPARIPWTLEHFAEAQQLFGSKDEEQLYRIRNELILQMDKLPWAFPWVKIAWEHQKPETAAVNEFTLAQGMIFNLSPELSLEVGHESTVPNQLELFSEEGSLFYTNLEYNI